MNEPMETKTDTKQSEPESAAKSFLFVVNSPPYGDERAYNGLRLAMNLSKRAEARVRVFLTGDGVACARAGQSTPDGFYNVERMVRFLVQRGEVAT
jgi:uncharacterized protein involved in oxidation of intracellular sulfur